MRIQRSAGTNEKSAAQEFHDKVKADLWRQSKLGEKPEKMWMDAVGPVRTCESCKSDLRDKFPACRTKRKKSV